MDLKDNMSSTPNTQVITNEVLLKILKSALQGELSKVAQQAPTDATSIAKKLVNKLTREFSGKPAASNVTSDLPDTESVSPTSLGTIDKLIQYLARNKIKIDGQQIAYSGDEYLQLPDETKKNLGKFSAKLSRDASSLKWNDDDFWINVQALGKYISYLQQKADTMQRVQNNPEGRLLAVQVGKLVDELNGRINPNSGLSRKPKGSPDKPAEMADETVVDSFSDEKLLDAKNPRADAGGGRSLFAKNLRSKESLTDWLLGGGEWGGPAHIVAYDAKGAKKLVPYTEDDVDQCAMVNALYQRATNRLGKARNEEEKKRFSFYVSKVKELGSTFVGADGKACSIGAARAEAPVAGVPGGAIGGGNVTAEKLQQMAQALPLDPNKIDFHRIKYFFDLYKTILATSTSPRKSEIQSSMDQAEQYMVKISSMTKSKDQIFNLNDNPSGFINLLNGPPIGMYNSFIQNLQYVVERTAAVIDSFYAQYVRRNYGENTKVVLSDDERQAVEEQSLGTNSFAMRNKYRLASLLQGAPKFV
jgi:hypothetical protein